MSVSKAKIGFGFITLEIDSVIDRSWSIHLLISPSVIEPISRPPSSTTKSVREAFSLSCFQASYIEILALVSIGLFDFIKLLDEV